MKHPASSMTLDPLDRRIVNALQDDFPLSPRPYADAAALLGLDEGELIDRLKSLLERGAITRFGPFFDAEAMGGAFCLCAMAVPPERFDEVASLVNAHAEVAHNYERAHQLNMWFVLATETPDEIGRVADDIAAESGLHVCRFPKQREFFVGFRVAA